MASEDVPSSHKHKLAQNLHAKVILGNSEKGKMRINKNIRPNIPYMMTIGKYYIILQMLYKNDIAS